MAREIASGSLAQIAGNKSTGHGWFARTDYEYRSQSKTNKNFVLRVYQVTIIKHWRINFSATKNVWVEVKYNGNTHKKSGTYTKGISTPNSSTDKTVTTFYADFTIPYDDNGNPPSIRARSCLQAEVQELSADVFRKYFESDWGTVSSSDIDKLILAPTMTISSLTPDLDTFVLAWTSSISLSGDTGTLQYTTNDGTNWRNIISSNTGKSGSLTIKHDSTGADLKPNTKYTVKIRGKTTSYGTSSAKSVTTKKIASISSSADFSIGDSLSFTKSNPSGATNNLKLEIGEGISLYSMNNVSDDSLTIPLNEDAYVDKLYQNLQGTSNTISTKITLETVGVLATYTSTKSGTATLTGNVKTARIAPDGETTPRRVKVWIGDSSGVPRRAICWVGVNDTPKRSK